MSSSRYDMQAQYSPNDRRSCWVCFASEDDDPRTQWTHPCRCRGTGHWVHQFCLQRWIDEKQAGNSSVAVYCPQCNTQYLIDYPALGTFLKLIEQVDGFFNRISPLATAGLLVGSLYWSAVTYGAVTVFQVLGQRTGLRIMEESDPLVLLIGLPTIPLTLILAKMIRWHDYVLRGWRHLTPGMVFFKYLFPNESTEHQVPMRVPTEDTVVDATSATRTICGALALPSIAMFCGNILFNHSPSRTKRIFLGGLVYVLTKGCLKMYYKQQQYLRLAKRKIRDYPADYF